MLQSVLLTVGVVMNGSAHFHSISMTINSKYINKVCIEFLGSLVFQTSPADIWDYIQIII